MGWSLGTTNKWQILCKLPCSFKLQQDIVMQSFYATRGRARKKMKGIKDFKILKRSKIKIIVVIGLQFL